MIAEIIRLVRAVAHLGIQREVDPNNPPPDGTAILQRKGGKLFFYRYGGTDEPIPLREAFRRDVARYRRAK